MIGLDAPCGEHGGGIKLSYENSQQQQNIEHFRNNLRNFQVSLLCDNAAVMYDDIDRMQLKLTDLDFAIRTSIDDYAELNKN